MDDRIENAEIATQDEEPVIGNFVDLTDTNTSPGSESLKEKLGVCGSADCACYGDNGCDDVDNGGGDAS